MRLDRLKAFRQAKNDKPYVIVNTHEVLTLLSPNSNYNQPCNIRKHKLDYT